MTAFVTVRLYAAARAAADGKSEISAAPGTLENILGSLSRENLRLSHVFAQCSYLVDGVAAHDMHVEIRAGSTIDVLPPFAGG